MLQEVYQRYREIKFYTKKRGAGAEDYHAIIPTERRFLSKSQNLGLNYKLFLKYIDFYMAFVIELHYDTILSYGVQGEGYI